ncbi:MAG TPA: CoA pyrophosphatase [Flavobacterium sp.]|jgi:8-oxo-dGTP pyrophosphatase MutT (NUDIX family)
MDFKTLLKIIPNIVEQDLSGTLSHDKLSPPERKMIMENLVLPDHNTRKAAVLMLLYPKKNESMHLVLIIRNTYAGVHSSQIAFPGGKVETFDASYEATALRETYEEIGIHPDLVTIIKAFTEIYIPPSNFMVYPFLGYADHELSFTLDPREVTGIIEIPVTHLLDDKNVALQNMSTSYMQNIDVPVFNMEGKVIWGATAMILSELKDVLNKL